MEWRFSSSLLPSFISDATIFSSFFFRRRERVLSLSSFAPCISLVLARIACLFTLLSLSFLPSTWSPSHVHGTALGCRRVDDRFVGARGRDQTHRPTCSFPRAVTRPRLDHSFVPLPEHTTLSLSLSVVVLLCLFRRYRPASRIETSPSKTDRCWSLRRPGRRVASSLSPSLHSLAAKPYYSLFCILSCTSEASACISRPVGLRRRVGFVSLEVPSSLPRLAINIYLAFLTPLLSNRRNRAGA